MTRSDQDTPPLETAARMNPEKTDQEAASFGGLDRREATQQLGRDLRRVCLDQAWDHYRQQDFEKAVVLCRDLLAGDGQSVPYRVLLAVSLFRLGRADEALKEIDELVRQAPDSSDLLELRALLRAS